MKGSVGGPTRIHRDKIRYAGLAGIRSLLADKIVEVRKLLRTDLSLNQIAEQLEVDHHTLKRFLKQRNICDTVERQKFINRQKAIEQERKRREKRR